jgi:hypothetical protein
MLFEKYFENNRIYNNYGVLTGVWFFFCVILKDKSFCLHFGK